MAPAIQNTLGEEFCMAPGTDVTAKIAGAMKKLGGYAFTTDFSADVTIMEEGSEFLERLPEIKESNILLEPARRNTAPCICWAAHHIFAQDPEASIMTLPSDHLILKEMAFIKAMDEGMTFVENNDGLLTLGIKPTSPETGYGYIQKGMQVIGSDDTMKVKSFTEKPNLEMAKMLIATGEFFWNSGIFLWNANTILKAFETYMPEICEIFKADEDDLEALPNISIDYAIMEKADNVYVQLCNFGWADLGTWGALHEASPKDQHKNVIINGHTMLYNCQNNIIAMPQGKLAVVQGLQDYLVADTDNVLLICKKDDESTIRRYVNDAQIKLGDEFV